MAKGWYVLHVYSGFEKRVESSLNSLIEEEKLDNILFKIFVPIKDVSVVKGGKKTIQHKKMFPGYILLEMDLDKQHWKEVYALIKNINGVSGFVGANKIKKPHSLPMEEAQKMLQVSGEKKTGETVRENIYTTGESVKIVDGPFDTFNGTIEEIDVEKGRLKVMVGIFGRSTPVELDFDQVEKI